MAQNLQSIHQEFVQLGRQLDRLQNALVEQGVGESETVHTHIDRAADALVNAQSGVAAQAIIREVQAGDAVERERLLHVFTHFNLASADTLAAMSDFELTVQIQGDFER